jgi:DNA adenine methylase
MARPRKKLQVKQEAQIGSFIKWAGGKGQLIEQYLPFFPRTLKGRGYVESFIGSGAIFFHVVQNLNPRSCTLLDVNPDLINTWREIRDNVEELIRLLIEHKTRHNARGMSEEQRKLYYYAVRAQEPDKAPERAARFIYLNKTCFNGLHRLNSKGKFNVPMGNYKEPGIFDADHLRQISRLLHNVTIETCPFQKCGRYIGDGDFVYLDPPYEPLSRTSNFTSYAKDAFTPENQRELRDLLEGLTPRADWMLSNSTAPLIEDLYAAQVFHKHRVLASRVINSKAKGRGKVEEFLITSYPVAKAKPQLVVANPLAEVEEEPA